MRSEASVSDEPHYEDLASIPIDIPHTLAQTTKGLRTAKAGLPELVKNAKDHYMRLEVNDVAHRQIVILVGRGNRRLAVLDFGGADVARLEKWAEWSSESAGEARHHSGIEAGYGNGGKAFMATAADQDAYILSIADGHASKRGYDPNSGPDDRWKPGWAKDSKGLLKGRRIDDPTRLLNEELGKVGCNLNALPEEVQRAWQERQAFTMVMIDSLREWERPPKIKDVQALVKNLIDHAQMGMALETCWIWVMHGDDVFQGRPLEEELPSADPAIPDPIIVDIPPELPDPETQHSIAMTDEHGSTGHLELRTSEKNLRLSALQGRNVIRIRNDRNTLGEWDVGQMGAGGLAAKVYGSLVSSVLTHDDTSGSTRSSLVETPTTRALHEFTATQVQDLARRLQAAKATAESDKEKNEANDVLEQMRQIMRHFLDDDGIEGRATPSPKDRGERVDVLLLEPALDTMEIPVGVDIPIIVRAYEVRGTKRVPVPSPAYEVVSANPSALDSPRDGIIRATFPGAVEIAVATPDGTVTSRSLVVEAHDFADLEFRAPPAEMKQGQRWRLEPVGVTAAGVRVPTLVASHVDPHELGTSSRKGAFTAGRTETAGTVDLHFGQDKVASIPITVGEDSVRQPPDGDSGVPVILMMGTNAPHTSELAPEQRTIQPTPDYPTIYEDPAFPNVVWINHSSVEAQRVRARHGSAGQMSINTPTFRQFMALKCFQVLKQLWVRQNMESDMTDFAGFMHLMSSAEMTCAPFIEQAYVLVEDLVGDK